VRRTDCPREAELLDALRAGTWPDAVPSDLRNHVQACASCSGLAELVPPLVDDWCASTQDACVPSSSVVWWRLQMRARREAAARAMQPIGAAQKLALAGAAGLLAVSAAALAPAAGRLAAWVGAIGHGAAATGRAVPPPTMAQVISPAGIALAMTGALLFVVVPVAIYFALSDR
jgi:hypothetical protein